MTVGEELIPPDFDDLNRQFYQEDGPGEYLMMRFHALCVIGGAYEPFKDILTEGVEFAGTTLSLVGSTDDPDAPELEADRTFQQHYLRIETHHLKHLAIETLLRLFLGHKDFPACPWFEISMLPVIEIPQSWSLKFPTLGWCDRSWCSCCGVLAVSGLVCSEAVAVSGDVENDAAV